MQPTFENVLTARTRISPFIHQTPVITSSYFNAASGCKLFFKCENLQKVGAFKIRGAANAVFSLTDKQAAKGVVTHSSGNHGAALALAAKWRGIPSWVVMPESAPEIKKRAVQGYGADVSFCETNLKARERACNEIIAKTGAEFIHPYNDDRVIAGQGTCAIELIEQVSGPLDTFIAPVGGGSLMSGSSIVFKAISPTTQIFGAEPEQADDAWHSLQEKKIFPATNLPTVADGLRTQLCPLTFGIISKNVKEIITVSEEEIINSMRQFWERTKLVIEPSSAVPFAAVLKRRDLFAESRVGIVITGGNVDLDKLPWIV